MTARTVLITGAGRNLGRAIALHLAAPGTHLLLHHHQSGAGASAVADEAAARGASARLLPADLADADAREALLATVATECDALHVLVHNAAIYPEVALLDTTPQTWQRVLDVNCGAVFHLTRGALPLLRAGAPARVVAIGDAAADRIAAHNDATPYHVAKLGVHTLVRSFAQALGADGITVNMISPGFMEGSLGQRGSPIPAGREGVAEDILGALDYLLSPRAAYVNGANLVVSGGWNR